MHAHAIVESAAVQLAPEPIALSLPEGANAALVTTGNTLVRYVLDGDSEQWELPAGGRYILRTGAFLWADEPTSVEVNYIEEHAQPYLHRVVSRVLGARAEHERKCQQEQEKEGEEKEEADLLSASLTDPLPRT